MTTENKILKTIQSHARELQTYGVRRVGLFGSYARSEQNPKSDIDILVEFNHGRKTFDNYMELKFFLERLFYRKIDLVTKESLKTEIKSQILSQVKYAQL